MTTYSVETASLTATLVVIRGEDEVALTIACWQDRDGSIEALRAFDADGNTVELDAVEDQTATDMLLSIHEEMRDY